MRRRKKLNETKWEWICECEHCKMPNALKQSVYFFFYSSFHNRNICIQLNDVMQSHLSRNLFASTHSSNGAFIFQSIWNGISHIKAQDFNSKIRLAYYNLFKGTKLGSGRKEKSGVNEMDHVSVSFNRDLSLLAKLQVYSWAKKS